MEELRIKKVFGAHFNLDYKRPAESVSDQESSFQHAFQDHFQEVLKQKPIFTDDVEYFLDQVIHNASILEAIQKKNIVALSRQAVEVYQFFVQQPSEDIQAKFYQVHVVLMLLVSEYGSGDAIALIELLWSSYIHKSKLQHDLAASLYDLALKTPFKLSHLRHELYTENQVGQKTQLLKQDLLKSLQPLNKSETLNLVLETLDKEVF